MKKLLEQLKLPLKSGCTITVSIRISTFPESGKCRKELYHAADVVLYEVKKSSMTTYKFSINIAITDMCHQ